METLATKYRPHSFAEIVGQPTVVSVLSRQIATNTFKSAYLFVGGMGLGKTSTARLLAKEINHGEGSPIEIDAASNSGIDNVRALISNVQQSSLDSDYTIVIVDEVQSFSKAAWDVMLKTIEEPPSNTIFIFCTTNPEKIPGTIMSRVQRFDFKKISYNEIADRLEFILNEEVIKDYDRAALERIAVLADGYMRTAITLLDKCISYGDVTLSNVEKVLDLVSYDDLFDIVESLVDKNSEKALSVVSKLQTLNFPIIDNLLTFLINCEKYKRTHNISVSTIPSIYKDRIKDIDYMPYIERLFRYRQLVLTNDAKTLINLFILEMCKE